MVEFYCTLVEHKKLTIEQVPEKYREKVRERINSNK